MMYRNNIMNSNRARRRRLVPRGRAEVAEQPVQALRYYITSYDRVLVYSTVCYIRV